MERARICYRESNFIFTMYSLFTPWKLSSGRVARNAGDKSPRLWKIADLWTGRSPQQFADVPANIVPTKKLVEMIIQNSIQYFIKTVIGKIYKRY